MARTSSTCTSTSAVPPPSTTPARLYSYVYADQTPDFPLPFTYPPFAAVVFYPLHLLPFGLVAFCWQVGTMAALYGVGPDQPALDGRRGRRVTASRCCGRRSPSGSSRCAAHSTTGRSTCCSCWRCCGRSSPRGGGCRGYWSAWRPGVKLTPAISGLYFVGVRRWGAAVFSAVVFLATVAVSVLVVGDQTRYYFTKLLGDAHRVGPIGTSFNQSWRGGISPDPGPRRRLRPTGPGRDRRHRGTGRPGLAGAGRFGSAGQIAGGRAVRAAAFADLLDAPLGVAGAVDDLGDSRATARAPRRAHRGLGVVGAHHHRRAVAAELRPADDLADQPTVVSGLGRTGLHRRGAWRP